jgi:hypothetical protein
LAVSEQHPVLFEEGDRIRKRCIITDGSLKELKKTGTVHKKGTLFKNE